MSEIGEISTSGNDLDVDIEWNILDFFSLPMECGLWYQSPDFPFGSHTWCMRIFPYGRSIFKTTEHVDLSLMRCSDGPPVRQEFSLSMKTAKGEKHNETYYTKVFHGYIIFDALLFLSRSELSRRQSELMPSGILTLVCTMKMERCDRTADNSSPASAEWTASSGYLTPRACPRTKRSACECPECLEVVVLQKWLDEHEFPEERAKAENGLKKYLRNTSVEASTQTVEEKADNGQKENAYVEASTQTEEEKDEDCVSVFSINPHEMKVLHDYKDLFLKKENCDVVIKIAEQEFPAHRLILRARSPVLESTFGHDMKENATGIVEIEDCDPSSFSDFLCFLYCGDTRMISQENVFSLFTSADKYEVLDLRVECLEFIKTNLTIDVFCEVITLALLQNETELIDLATDFFVKNAENILDSVKWQIFAAKNPKHSNELFKKFMKSKYSMA